ncbi:hypothetical protein ACH42_06935 [Endozoicomonas sp. (ex Bugula neritina AB1)]|nr:hypothetical protein ACH42_06935 [Endozoicomonas sp. (ex Bugula neritina AB1)]
MIYAINHPLRPVTHPRQHCPAGQAGQYYQYRKLQAPADAAEADLNSLITLKRSIDMSVQELIEMGIADSR